MQRIYIDMSTARGIQKRLEQRVVELKRDQPVGYEAVIDELLALIKEVDQGVEAMIDDMHRQDQERAMQQQIRLDDAGVTAIEMKSEQF